MALIAVNADADDRSKKKGISVVESSQLVDTIVLLDATLWVLKEGCTENGFFLSVVCLFAFFFCF